MATAWAAGSLVGQRYRVLGTVGSGSSGDVYRVRDETDDAHRAIKLLRPELGADEESRSRFLAAAKLAAELGGPHVAPVLDFGLDAATGLPFLVMPLLDGESLLERLTRLGPMAPAELLPIARDLAAGLEHIHSHRVVHRDVKPSNVFLVTRTEGTAAACRAVLLDFGLAKLVAARGKRADTTRNHGTPAYMAPEQMRGEGNIDARADLYSVGHVVFHALAGQPYWQRELERAPNLLRLVRAVSQPLPEPASQRGARFGARLPVRFDAWFERAIAASRARRHASASEQVAALAETLARPDG